MSEELGWDGGDEPELFQVPWTGITHLLDLLLHTDLFNTFIEHLFYAGH